MAKGYALLSMIRVKTEEIPAIRSDPARRVYVVYYGRTPEEGPLIGIGRAVPWKRFPGRVAKDGGASFRAFLAKAVGFNSRGLEAGFTKMRAIADKFAHVTGRMTIYNGRYYNAKHIAMMQAKERGET